MTITISTATQLRLLARKHVHTAIATIFGIMTSEGVAPNVRLSAATALIDRGFGRVPLMTSAESGELGLKITEIVTTIVDPKLDDDAATLIDDTGAALQLNSPVQVCEPSAESDETSDAQ